MRKIRRCVVEPPTLRPEGLGGKQAARNSDPDERRFPDHWNRADVRGVLYAGQWRVCAYCGELLSDLRGDVEHFRPKAKVDQDVEHSGYWWLAYSLANYHLSCRICNSTYKGNSFPMRARARHTRYETRTGLAREARLLLDPAIDDVEALIDIAWDPEAHDLVELRERDGVTRTHREQVRGSIEFFALNRERRLLIARKNTVDAVLAALDEGRDEDATELAVRFQPHSAVARAMLTQLRPAALPSEDDELVWLLAAVLEEYSVAKRLHATYPEDDRVAKDFEERKWTLAALWRSPPVGTAAQVEGHLADEGLLAELQEFYDALGG